MVSIPYISHSPVIRKTTDGFTVDAKTEEFMQAARLVGGLVGGPVVYYAGSVFVEQGRWIFGNTLRVLGVVCTAYNIWQYASVKMASPEYGGLLTNSAKAKKSAAGKKRISALGELAHALRKHKIISIPEDAYTLDDEE